MNKGKGIYDVLKDPYGTIKEAFKLIPSKLSNLSKKTMEVNGNNFIIGAYICRTPLNKILISIANAITDNEFNELVKSSGYDKLFHLSLVVILDNQKKITIEKNEVVTIKNYNNNDVSKLTETMIIQKIASHRITLNNLINNTLKYMGDSKFYDYDAWHNNCQVFIKSILISNDLFNESYNKFLFQDLNISRLSI